MTVGRLCNRTVVSIQPDESARSAAEQMKQHQVGALVVVADNAAPIGIVTDRDLVLRVMAEDRQPSDVEVREVMTPKPVCVPEHTSLEDAMNLLRGYQVRRLIVVHDNGQLAGILTLDDMLELLGEEQGAIAALMRSTRMMQR